MSFLLGEQARIAQKGKDLSLETLRGIAIILLVTYHTRDFSESDALYHFNYWIGPLRMPLFASISGYLYACRPIDTAPVGKFFKGKARRLLIPLATALFVWVIVTYLLSLAVPQHIPQLAPEAFTFQGINDFILYRPRTYWFLQSIFGTFLLVILAEKLRLLKHPIGWLVGVIGLFLCCSQFLGDRDTMDSLDFFSFNGTLYLTPYFLIGLGVKRFQHLLFRRPLLITYALLTVGLLWINFHNFDGGIMRRHEKYADPVPLALGAFSLLLLYRFRFTLPILPEIGYYAFSIYLFHRFFFELLSLTNTLFPTFQPPVIVYIIPGILIPIFIHRLAEKRPLPNLLLLGQTTRPQPKQPTT